MSQQTVNRVSQTVKWYEEHKNDGRSVDKEIAFLKKTIDCMLECVIRQQEDIRELEGRPKGSSNLYLPRGLDVAGDVRKFG